MRFHRATLLLLPAVLFGQDPFPALTVSYFNATSCPAGWTPYEPASGRAIVPVAPEGGVLAAVGTPLPSGSLPLHRHTLTTTLNLGDVGYLAIAGCCNGSLAEGGKHTLGFGLSEGGNLPYVQMLACQKTAAPEPAPIPRGATIFYEGLRCPAGWSEVTAAHGRFPVGGSRTSGTFGGPPLQPREERQHTHTFSAKLTLPSQAILAAGGSGQGYAASGTYSVAGTTSSAPSALPYLQLLQCSKDAEGPPQITSVLNGASFLSDAVAPGEIIAIFGTNLGPDAGVGAQLSGGQLTNALADARVLINGSAAPLFYAGKTQINAQVPYQAQSRATIQVIYQDQASNTLTVPVASSAPGLFIYPEPRSDEVIALVGSELSSAERPVPIGEPFVLWATGEGLTNPESANGRPRNEPLARPILPVTLTVGGVEAGIDYAGAAPGFVGLMQINARLAAGTPSGKVPIVLRIGTGESASGVNLYVK